MINFKEYGVKEVIVLITIIISICGVIYYGWDTRTDILVGVKTEYKVYYTAEFSENEYNPATGTNNYYSWDEVASDVYQLHTYNGEILYNESYYDYVLPDGIKCEPPTLIYGGLDSDPDFDNFAINRKFSIYGYLDTDERTIINEVTFNAFRYTGYTPLKVETFRLYGKLVKINLIE